MDGHTKHICEYISKKLNNKKKIEISSIEESKKFDLNKYDEIIIGASVRYGYHRKNVYKFVETQKKLLEQKKNNFLFIKLNSKERREKYS